MLDNVDPEPLRGPTATPTPTIHPILAQRRLSWLQPHRGKHTRRSSVSRNRDPTVYELSAQQTRDAETAAQQAAQAQAEQAAQAATAIVAAANATAAAIQEMQNANSTAQAAAYATAKLRPMRPPLRKQHIRPNKINRLPRPCHANPGASRFIAEIVQTGAGHNGDSVSGALVFQVVPMIPW